LDRASTRPPAESCRVPQATRLRGEAGLHSRRIGVERPPVGVVVERSKSAGPWTDFLWRPITALGGAPDPPPWTKLSDDGERATFFVGTADIELYRSEAGNYRQNLLVEMPLLWVLPLVLYLLSFILVFSRLPEVVHLLLARTLPMLIVVQAYLLFSETTLARPIAVALHLLVLRPPPASRLPTARFVPPAPSLVRRRETWPQDRALLALRVADPTELARFVVVAVKLALDLSDVTVRPISTSAESAMPARSVVDLRICWSFPRRLAGTGASRAVYERNYVSPKALGHRRPGGEHVRRW